MFFFCEIWLEASFYINEQVQKIKFIVWILKTTFLTPE